MNVCWENEGVANELLAKLEAAALIDVEGVLSDDAPAGQKLRSAQHQEVQGAGGGFFSTIVSLPGAGRDALVYLRTVITDEHAVDGKRMSLEQQYFGCLAGDDWIMLVDRDTMNSDEPYERFRDVVFDTLGPGPTLWWDDKARTGQHLLDGIDAYDILLQPVGGHSKLFALVIAEPVENAKRLYDWIVSSHDVRNDPIWQGATVMLADNRTGIARQWTVLGSTGDPI